LGESEVEAVLQRLDRLTQDEARITVAQTLGVVHGLVNNMKVVMDGQQFSLDLSPKPLLSSHYIRWKNIYEWDSTILGQVSRSVDVFPVLTYNVVALHQVVYDMNKLKRLFQAHSIHFLLSTEDSSQVTSYKERSNDGSLLRTLRPTMTLSGRRTTKGPEHGSLRATY
jgi:hypothetical protein